MASEGEAGRVLVVGGGIAGITAALEAAETGVGSVLVERSTHLGGQVARLARYFPKLCPPTCGLEINYQRLRSNPAVEVLVDSEVVSLEGGPGHYRATIETRARHVNERCTACGECASVCPVERPNTFDHSMSKTKAAYLPHQAAFPMRYAIDPDACLFWECARCVDACSYGAIELDQKPARIEIEAAAVILATGWEPYDAAAISNLGFGSDPDIVTNVMFERMAADDGPTGGRILRPSNGAEVASVAFVQCAGSRDRLHLPYCSSICCLASLKEAALLVEKVPSATAHIYYIDLRTPGTYESFADKVLSSPQIEATKGKVAEVRRDEADGRLVVVADDMVSGRMSATAVDLVVLATGMVASGGSLRPEEEFGFHASRSDGSGVFAAGCASGPVDVATATLQATAAAMGAIGVARKSGALR